MEALRAVMVNILVIVFLTTLLDLLLPEGSLRGYVKMTMGFFVVLTLLQPILQLVQPDNLLQQWQLAVPEREAGDSLTVEGAVYEARAAQLEQLYGEKINEQVRALLLLTTDLEQVQVDSVVEDQCLRQIRVQISATDGVDASRVAQALSGYYGLAAEQILVETEETGVHGVEESE